MYSLDGQPHLDTKKKERKQCQFELITLLNKLIWLWVIYWLYLSGLPLWLESNYNEPCLLISNHVDVMWCVKHCNPKIVVIPIGYRLLLLVCVHVCVFCVNYCCCVYLYMLRIRDVHRLVKLILELTRHLTQYIRCITILPVAN